MTLAIALLVGMAGQSLGYHLRLPGLVLLLLLGVILGPEGFDVIHPATLGDALAVLAGFVAAVILFDAGTNLEWRLLRREAPAVQHLATAGAVITWLLGAIVVGAILGWDMWLSLLFGSLMIGTGPAVVAPLLRRIRVRRNLQTILETEGVLVEAAGALIAAVAFCIVFSDGGSPLVRIGVGVLVGAVGALVMLILVRSRRLVPSGMERVFVLALAWATYQISDTIATGSGLAAALLAGVTVANLAPAVNRSLRESKEQLTGIMMGALFVLIAAEMRFDDVAATGWRGVAVIAALMWIVRPLSVWVCAVGAGLSLHEKAFLSWISPRGVVAASLVALFYLAMSDRGADDAEAFRALVLVAIVGTALVQAFTGSMMAGWLGVKRPRGQGYVILGGNPLAVEVARALKIGGEDSVLIDANPSLCSEVEAKGFRVLHGNALDERIMLRAELDTRKAIISLLPNDGVNLLFARRAVDEYRADRVYVAMHGGAIKPAHVSEIRGRILFGSAADVDQWASRLGRGEALVERWAFAGVPDPKSNPTMPVPKEQRTALLPITLARGTTVRPVDDRYEPKKGDLVTWALATRREDDARTWLRGRGWMEAGSADA